MSEAMTKRKVTLPPALRGVRLAAAALAATMLGACGGLGQVAPAPQVLDVGAAETAPQPLPPRVPIAVPAVEAAPLLQGQGVIWRERGSLAPQAYASYQWASPPADLLAQRLRERLAVEGPVLPAGGGGAMPEVRVALERFEQVFDPGAATAGSPISVGDMAVRVVLSHRGEVLDQLRLALSVPAASDDAPGGARALSGAVESIADAIAEWLSRQPGLRAGSRPR